MKDDYKVIAAGLILATLVGVGAYAYAQALKAGDKNPPVACSMIAKACPDGSYVSRTGPNCEFAQCPDAGATTTPPTPTAGTLAIGEQAVINGTMISVLGLTEDSRCAVDVQCIWAGQIRVRVAIDAYNRDFEFIPGTAQTVGSSTITLIAVSPAERNSKVAVSLSDYRFTFSVVRKATVPPKPVPLTSGIRGTVTMGPTCPVEHYPPDPACADKGYATTITIRMVNSTKAVATTQSDANGTFSVPLSPGNYTLTAQGATMLPRCLSTSAVVTQGSYVIANISCDTGIR